MTLFVFIIILSYFIFNGFVIYNYSFNYSEKKSDVAIVLGAGTNSGKLSPIFKERINQSLYLYNKKITKKIILTGGFGINQLKADSEIAKEYLLIHGIPNSAIIIEKKSKYTIENIIESKHIMDSLGLNSALIVSDPLHMKRSMKIAEKLNINCQPSPTKTTMYKSFFPKLFSLTYETFYYTLGKLTGQ
ncbi:YdcF family protein [Flavobacterium sp. J27]|uniref:YdcF family protein n=1 Tax=Flavobacterium sp. J27 TaxID=2060419 RepID=UPI0013EEABC1|nr:YdcF family protein [Flavobacterium sp. J27]